MTTTTDANPPAEAPRDPDTAAPDTGSGEQSTGRSTAPSRFARFRAFIGVRGFVSILVGVLLLGVCAYLLTAFSVMRSAALAYEAGDGARTVERSDLFEEISPFEKHKPPFNRGTVAAAEGRWDDAEGELRTALDLTPEADECAVRQNLAFVYEMRAEEFKAAGDTANANTNFDEGKKILEESPESCRPEGSAQDQASDQASERMQESQDGMNNPPPQDQGEGESGDQEGESGEPQDGDGTEDGDGTGDQGGSENEETGGEDSGGSDGTGDEEGQEGESMQGSNGEDPTEQKRQELRERSQAGQSRQQEGQEWADGGGGAPVDKPW